MLRLKEHRYLKPQTCGLGHHLLALELAAALRSGEWWIEPGPDAPRQAQVVEGPAVVKDGQVHVEVLTSEACRLSAGAQV